MLVNYFFKEKNTSSTIHTSKIHRNLEKKKENVSKILFFKAKNTSYAIHTSKIHRKSKKKQENVSKLFC
jgi:hypothetical protein